MIKPNQNIFPIHYHVYDIHFLPMPWALYRYQKLFPLRIKMSFLFCKINSLPVRKHWRKRRVWALLIRRQPSQHTHSEVWFFTSSRLTTIHHPHLCWSWRTTGCEATVSSRVGIFFLPIAFVPLIDPFSCHVSNPAYPSLTQAPLRSISVRPSLRATGKFYLTTTYWEKHYLKLFLSERKA